MDYLKDWTSLMDPSLRLLNSEEIKMFLLKELFGQCRKSYVERLHAAFAEKRRVEERDSLMVLFSNSNKITKREIENVINHCGF